MQGKDSAFHELGGKVEKTCVFLRLPKNGLCCLAESPSLNNLACQQFHKGLSSACLSSPLWMPPRSNCQISMVLSDPKFYENSVILKSKEREYRKGGRNENIYWKSGAHGKAQGRHQVVSREEALMWRQTKGKANRPGKAWSTLV